MSSASATTSRKTSGDSDEGPPPRKIHKIMFEPKRLVSVSNLEDMDLIVCKFQIAKIRERLDTRVKEENELRLRIEQLEKRQTQDDAVLNVVNRYWNQLNEDLRIMLQRFDTETSDEIESNNENAATTSFLSEMANWDKNELDEKLAKKVQVSTRAVTKMVQAFDRLFQRSEKLSAILKADVDEETPAPIAALDETTKQEYIQRLEENKQVQLLNTSLHTKLRTMSLKMKELAEKLMGEETEIDELKNRVSDLEYEFEDMNADCKKKAELLTWKEKVQEVEELLGNESVPDNANKDVLTSSEIVCLEKEQEELTDLAEERRKELEMLKQQHINTLQEIDRLNKEIQNIPEQTVKETTEYKCLQSKFSVIYHESVVLRQLIQDVKKKLFAVNSEQVSQTKEMEEEESNVQKVLQGDMSNLEDTLTQLKKEYEMLRMEFEKNAAANEQVAPVHREMRNLITQLQQHNQQIKAEGQRFRTKCTQIQDENTKAKKYNGEIIQKIEKLQQARKERGSSQSHGHGHGGQPHGVPPSAHLASGSTGPTIKTEIKTESGSGGPVSATAPMSSGVTAATTNSPSDPIQSNSTKNQQGEAALKAEPSAEPVGDVKIKQESGRDESTTVAGESGLLDPAVVTSNVNTETPTIGTEPATTSPKDATAAASSEDVKIKLEPGTPVKHESTNSSGIVKSETTASSVKQEPPMATVAGTSSTFGGAFLTPALPKKISEAEQAQMQEWKTQLKKCLGENKEMKLLLDMYKGQNKDQTDRVELMVNERKAKLELEEVKQEYRRLQDNLKKEEKKKVAEEDLSSKMKVLEERIASLKRQIAAQKQEEEALLNEMDVTGQAFEDMQEQNSRLIQQLREKENANFKLMSDRIKANRVQELLKEEKEAQHKSNQILVEHLEHKYTVIRKLEEIERQLVGTIAQMEKEAMVRQQAMELNKRKAIESAQSAADLKLHLEKYHSQMKEAQQLVAEKTSALAAEAFKSKRYSEELSILTSRLERLKKIEISGNTDEVVMAEIQEYKEMLTCPSCKVRRKDAVLTKCFHVFCFDCLRTRYETRQRKCPRCNAAFGANDYHRLYLS